MTKRSTKADLEAIAATMPRKPTPEAIEFAAIVCRLTKRKRAILCEQIVGMGGPLANELADAIGRLK